LLAKQRLLIAFPRKREQESPRRWDHKIPRTPHSKWLKSIISVWDEKNQRVSHHANRRGAIEEPMNTEGLVALVTGANKGLGKEVVSQLARRGMIV
jgi:hypothetical protein